MFSCGGDLHTRRNSRPKTIEANVVLTEDDSKRDSEMTRRAQQHEYIHDGRYGPNSVNHDGGESSKTGIVLN
jgi:hypothetical protein